MIGLDVVLADIAAFEGARDALPPNSHVAALLSLTLYRLQEEADTMRACGVNPIRSTALPSKQFINGRQLPGSQSCSNS